MDSSLVTAIVTTVLGGGVVGSIIAILKFKPEGDQILVSSAKDVVLIQKGALDELRRQMDDLEERLTGQLATAEKARQVAEAALASANQERREVAVAYRAEQARNQELMRRVEALEAEVAELRATTPPRGRRPTRTTKPRTTKPRQPKDKS